MNMKRIASITLSLLFILGIIAGCGYVEEEDCEEYTEAFEEEEGDGEEDYVEIAEGEVYVHSSVAFSIADPFPLEEEGWFGNRLTFPSRFHQPVILSEPRI